MAKTYKIHPAIGIARIGNSPEEFFIGPEKPEETVSPDSLPASGLKDFRYKDAQYRIKRQAARFRLFEYGDDGKPVKEVTLKDAEVESISWKVELANTKTWFRNEQIEPKLKLAPPAANVSAPGTKATIIHTFAQDSPKFKGKKVTLGEIQSEAGTGRLLVLGGFGQSAADPPESDLLKLANAEWHDDVADGTVKAFVKLKGIAQPLEAAGAWVVVGPPKFAPPLPSVVTLYDLLVQRAIFKGLLPKPATISFTDDIYPIFQRAFGMKWLTAVLGPGNHTTFDAPANVLASLDESTKGFILGRLRNPNTKTDKGWTNFTDHFGPTMPLMMGDADVPDFTVTPFQYEMIQSWATTPEGKGAQNLVAWVKDSIAAPPSVPQQLDRAALEACIGGGFFPGIEMSKIIRDDDNKGFFAEPFRLVHDPAKLLPGDLTKQMALPWQADFMSCRRHPEVELEYVDAQGVTQKLKEDVPWWPSHRPDDVFPETEPGFGNQVKWIRDIVHDIVPLVDNEPIVTPDNPKGRRLDRQTMNARWHMLGFVVRRDDQYVETERNPTIKWETESLLFNDVPEGYGTSRPIDLEVKCSLKIIFKPMLGPTLTASFDFDQTQITVEPTGPDASKKIRFWVTYKGGVAGQVLNGIIHIEALQADGPCPEDYCLLGQHEIEVQASSVPRQASATMLVLDRSGSMEETVLGGQQKIEVLRRAAKSFVELALKGDGIGIARYNDTSDVLSFVKKLETEGDAQARAELKELIDSDELKPWGETSIGSGLIKASEAIKQADKKEYPLSAFVVLTDGKENHTPHIDSPEVSAALPSGDASKRIYAIGLGQPGDIDQERLDKLTQSSDQHKGALLITGDLTAGDDQFRLQKYFVQILAGVSNAEIVLDPQGELIFGIEKRIPFHMTEADIGMDVILLSTSPRAVDFRLENPSGQLIGTGQPLQTPALKYVVGDGLSFYRLFFSSAPAGNDRAGPWHAILKYGDAEDDGNQKLSAVESDDVSRIHYSLIVHAYSNLRLQASARQESYAPGAEILLRASITEYDMPVTTAARIWAEITDPFGERGEIELKEVEPGQFAASLHTSAEGVYRARLRASGASLQGTTFSREQTLTPSVSHGRHTGGARRGCLPRFLHRLLRWLKRSVEG